MLNYEDNKYPDGVKNIGYFLNQQYGNFINYKVWAINTPMSNGQHTILNWVRVG